MKKKVLIIENEKPLLSVITDRFVKEGFEVISAANGKDGLDSALKNHPDVILLDIVIPVIDGATLLGELRKDSWGKDAQVVLLTNLTNAEKKMKAYQKGIFEYLMKCDIAIDELVDQVKKKIKERESGAGEGN